MIMTATQQFAQNERNLLFSFASRTPMNPTSIAALSVPQFAAAGINLARLGLNPTDPTADRVRDGLTALRQSMPQKATKGPVNIRQTVPGLAPADAKELAHAIVNSQLAEGMGIDGKKVALEVAVRLADALDAFHGYFDMMDAVPLDLSNVAGYVDLRCWAATPRHVQQLVEQYAEADRKRNMKQINQEIANLTAMLDQVDRTGGTALELFERRRMQREGLRPRAIDKAIATMKVDGRIPAAKENGQQL